MVNRRQMWSNSKLLISILNVPRRNFEFDIVKTEILCSVSHSFETQLRNAIAMLGKILAADPDLSGSTASWSIGCSVSSSVICSVICSVNCSTQISVSCHPGTSLYHTNGLMTTNIHLTKMSISSLDVTDMKQINITEAVNWHVFKVYLSRKYIERDLVLENMAKSKFQRSGCLVYFSSISKVWGPNPRLQCMVAQGENPCQVLQQKDLKPTVP